MSSIYAIFSILTLCLSQSDDSIVDIEYGRIKGNVSPIGRAFRSVPYAAPPIHKLRWHPPQPHQPWNNTLQTIFDPPGCIQKLSDLVPYVEASTISEDCLYLNVFTPLTNICNVNNPICPVMIFFYGGGYNSGFCGGWLYNGTNLAYLTNTIIVTVNYRVGALGFLYDNNNEIYGNMGYLDGVFATNWTKKNIASFGGNGNKITIFGQSAGARFVGTMLVDTTIDGLFQNTIMESHGMTTKMMTVNDWIKYKKAFYDALGCDNINCLYNVTSDEILSAQEQSPRRQDFGPTLGISDHVKIPSLLSVQENIYNKDVNVMIGVTKQEAWLFEPSPLDEIAYNVSVLDLAILIGGDIDDNYNKIYEEYPCNNCDDIEYRDNYALMRTDYGFNCPARNGSISIARHNNSGRIYSYHFDYASRFNKVLLPLSLEHQCYDRACHTSELPYVFQPDFQYCPGCENGKWTQNETLLANIIQFYWGTFALNGNPGNGQNKFTNVEWIEFDSKNLQSIVFNIDTIEMKNNYDAQHCPFWDSLRTFT
eukprot:488856_1